MDLTTLHGSTVSFEPGFDVSGMKLLALDEELEARLLAGKP